MRFSRPIIVTVVAILVVALALVWALRPPAPPRVVATIKPLHSLVAGVMEGVGTPELLIRSLVLPESYALGPADLELLGEADIVFSISDELETFLAELSLPLRRLVFARGLDLLPRRDGPIFADWPGPAVPERVDPHVWLDPANARLIVVEIVRALQSVDPANAERYAANGEALAERLAALEAEIHETLAPVRGRAYVAYRDAYAYFERRFDMPALGALTASGTLPPDAARIARVREALAEGEGICVMSEWQFSPTFPYPSGSGDQATPYIEAAIAGTSARMGKLDALGMFPQSDAESYFALLRANARYLLDCLTRGADRPAGRGEDD